MLIHCGLNRALSDDQLETGVLMIASEHEAPAQALAEGFGDRQSHAFASGCCNVMALAKQLKNRFLSNRRTAWSGIDNVKRQAKRLFFMGYSNPVWQRLGRCGSVR